MNERDIFMVALQSEAPADRQAYLAEACQGDEALRQGVETLLAAHERAGSFLAAPPSAYPLPAAHPDIAGSLQNLGSLLKGLGKFADSEAALLESERILITAQGLPPASHDRCVEALVQLYSAWNQAEPGKGHDAKAEQWRANLPTTRPAKRPPQ